MKSNLNTKNIQHQEIPNSQQQQQQRTKYYSQSSYLAKYKNFFQI
ncbi:1056_t:CDS:2 [Acaulospora colombiana]|uniref:1056_t:CDS:1 n=1 Tax=Acaulospora colombiana TaxID=27376 RepID=A0ACA9K026_9GLOM|nr:1056_t:CDS:2 [Acaulospora colombiana]